MIYKKYQSWAEIVALVEGLLQRIPHDYEAILAITRGGMVPACLISERLGIRNILVAAVQFYTGVGESRDHPVLMQFPADPMVDNKRILIVDDIWDSGRTIMMVKQRVEAAGGIPTTCVLHYKPARSLYPDRPDYYAVETDEWIVYPWEPPEE